MVFMDFLNLSTSISFNSLKAEDEETETILAMNSLSILLSCKVALKALIRPSKAKGSLPFSKSFMLFMIFSFT
ncbi:MAG: hypothetical protein BWY78_01495 [Alphaproteobacteria bacterium ADurb.Bin438]|nr:MAG: hypothetical protein BWY78_01495 [Alphaproteobacteria bacterium ADurb.Bin438]